MVAEIVISEEPLKNALPVMSPLKVMFLAVVNVLAVLAMVVLAAEPDILPTKVVAVMTLPVKLPKPSLLTKLPGVLLAVALSTISV